MALSTGSLLAGRYEIDAPVAVGGMGEVWRARDRVLDRIVAAKVLKSEFTGDPNFLARFRNEARHTAALSHPNIASVYDYGETLDEHGRTVAYLVMEFVEGQPLVSILSEEGRLPVDWTMHVLVQAADGLSAAHRAGVIHRDIKPGNLIVRPDGVVKLTDFGIAQARDAAPLTRTGMVVGTAQYLSPEQAQGLELTAASDVYSLGVVGYECLAGVRPFDGASQVAIALAHINRPPPPLPADVPGPVRDLIGRALAKDSTQRFADGGAFADAVRAVAAGGAIAGAVPAAGAVTEVMSTVEGDGTRVLDDGAAAWPGTGATRVASTSPGRAAVPLQGPPVHDEPQVDPYADRYADEPPRRRRGLWLAAGLVLLLGLVAGVWFALAGSGGSPAATSPGTTGPTAATSAPATAATVAFDPASLIGQDVDQVAAQLQAEGLNPKKQVATAQQLAAAGRSLKANAVAATTPDTATSVPVGGTVVLSYAKHAYTAPAGGTDATTSAAPTSAAPPTTSAPTASATTAPPTTTRPAPTTSAAPTTAAPPTTTAPPASGSPAPSPTPTPAPTTTDSPAAAGATTAPVTAQTARAEPVDAGGRR